MEALFSELEQARNAWANLYALLVQANYNVSRNQPQINNQTVEMLHRRAVFVLESIAALQPKEPNSSRAIILSAKAHEVRETLQAFSTKTQEVFNAIQPHFQEGYALSDADENFTMQMVQPDGGIITTFALSENFGQINKELNQLTAHLSYLLPLCKAEGVGDLSQRANALADVVREMSALREQAQKMAKSAASSAASVADRDNTAQNIVEQARMALAQVQAFQQQATTDVGTVSALVEQIKVIGINVGSLEQQVNAYQSNFEAFQMQLDARNLEFTQFQDNEKRAKEANIKRESEIDRLTNQADAMISGATTAGLAKAMEDARARYEKRMNGARKGFYLAVILLIASAIPLAAHLLPGLFGNWIQAFDSTSDGSLYAAIGKIVLLLPATWLTAFFTKSYADFFHLEREYAHKAALAMSVDGFKRQAPDYEQAITAEVFLEIRDNPAKGRAVEAVSHPMVDMLAKFYDVIRKKDET